MTPYERVLREENKMLRICLDAVSAQLGDVQAECIEHVKRLESVEEHRHAWRQLAIEKLFGGAR